MNTLVLIGQKQNRSRIVFLGVTLGHLMLTVLNRCTERLAWLLPLRPAEGSGRGQNTRVRGGRHKPVLGLGPGDHPRGFHTPGATMRWAFSYLWGQ